jgi:MFS family permease
VRATLRSPRLRRILFAYTVNRLGTLFGVIALMVAVYDHTRSAVAVAGLLLAGQALPAFVVPAVVVRVEASRRRGELSGLYFFEAVAVAAQAILLLSALDGTAALTASSLLRSELAHAARAEVGADAGSDRAGAEQEAERRANATLNLGFTGTAVLGPALAGVLVAAAGASTALFIDVASFVICGALLLDLHPHVEEAGSGSVRERLRAGWEHINEAPMLGRLLLAYGVVLVFLQSAAPIEVTYAKATLMVGDRGFGLLLTVWGTGAVLGSIVFARAERWPPGALLGAGASAIGVAYIGFAAAPSLAPAAVAALVGGIGNGIETPALVSLVQGLSPAHLQGRMMGAVESLSALGLAVGLPFGGLLTAVSSPRLAFLVVGVGGTATSIAFFRMRAGEPERGWAPEPAPD